MSLPFYYYLTRYVEFSVFGLLKILFEWGPSLSVLLQLPRKSWAPPVLCWPPRGRTDSRWVSFTPFTYNRGCWWGFLRRILWKKELQADSITLWAWICSSSHARVTSKKSLSSRSSLKALLMLCSKSFQRRQNFSEFMSSMVTTAQTWYHKPTSAWVPAAA